MIPFIYYIKIAVFYVMMYVVSYSYTVTDISEEPVAYIFRAETPTKVHGITDL
jgi:hypothetical protein